MITSDLTTNSSNQVERALEEFRKTGSRTVWHEVLNRWFSCLTQVRNGS